MEQINWELCILCKRNTAEKLVCPLSNPIAAIKEGSYKDRLNVVRKFNEEVGHCPHNNLDLPSEQILRENNASWHRSCRDMYKPTSLQKTIAQKRKAEGTPAVSKRVCRSMHTVQTQNCLFCLKNTNERDHAFQNVELTQIIRDRATVLGDFRMVGLLAPPNDLVAIKAKYH